MVALSWLRCSALSQAANNGLVHFILTCFSHAATQIWERKGDVSCRPRYLRPSNRQLAANVALDESRFVALPLFAPGVHPHHGEIARLAFWPVRADQQVLWHWLSGGGIHAIQFSPGNYAHPGRAGIIGHRLRDVEFDEAA